MSYGMTSTTFEVWTLPCTRENEAHNILAGNSILKMARSGMGETILKTHLCMGTL